MTKEQSNNNNGKDTKHSEMEEIPADSNKNGVSLFDDEDQIQEDKEIESDGESEGESSEEEKEKACTYPADCYSFLALYDPIHNPGFFSFAFVVWAFQISFLVLLVLRVVHKRLSTNPDIDNPSNDIFASFIPSNVGSLTRATQFFAILSYCFFADESLKDVVTAVETFPRFDKAKLGDKTRCMVVSCALRFIQGSLAILAVVLLVVTTSDVIEIILNFTAVNFISGFDDVAFELAKWGKYGPTLQKEAKRIEELPVPHCIYRKHKNVRYTMTVVPIALALVFSIGLMAYCQDSTDYWLTKTLRVQFSNEMIMDEFNGCYGMSLEVGHNRLSGRRALYEGYEENEESAKFGYCIDDRKWSLYRGKSTTSCGISEDQQLAYSERTTSFDISTSFESTWYSRSGTPLDLYFFENESSLDDVQCNSFLGDGNCDSFFNIVDYQYDEGDCCAATCNGLNCGRGNLVEVFETPVPTGDGYPRCQDPEMKPITILINDVYLPERQILWTPEDYEDGNSFYDIDPREPLLVLDCDNIPILMTSVSDSMANKSETVMVADGADCSFRIKNTTSGPADIWYVNYTVFHGDKSSIESDPIVIVQTDSSEQVISYFRRINDCFFTKLSDYIDISSIYTGTNPENEAITWLMEDSSGYCSCDDEFFIECFALSVINFAAPMNETYNGTQNDGLWITRERPCLWEHVECIEGSVFDLDLASLGLSGTISSSVGLLSSLKNIELSNNNLRGTIPSQIGELNKNFSYIGLYDNQLTGSIPSAIGTMTDLRHLDISRNYLTGSIPSQMGRLTNLAGLYLKANLLTGSIPNEIGQLTDLFYLYLSDNELTGSIPSELGLLTSLIEVHSSSNELSGSIPSELGELASSTKIIELGNNFLTGSVPSEMMFNSTINIDIYNNSLSNLIDVNGQVICTLDQSEHYCDCSRSCTYAKNRCTCQEGKECCAAYEAQFDECIICDDAGTENPGFYVGRYAITCGEANEHIRDNLAAFGTSVGCNFAIEEYYSLGCRCKNDPRTREVLSNITEELEI